MTAATISYFELQGWEQSHTATPNGIIFERLDDGGGIELIVVNPNGVLLSKNSFDKYAVEAGVASVTVAALYKSLREHRCSFTR
jgi:hypothetical protein